ncbi:hypothetical protein SESBI_07268 [Sesbania bispinosa]|nr:hypothetical protein SESBI_07268 [Sesbania bispinosa]
MAKLLLKNLCLDKAAIDDEETNVDIGLTQKYAQVEYPSETDVLEKSDSGNDHSRKMGTENEGCPKRNRSTGKGGQRKKSKKCESGQGTEIQPWALRCKIYKEVSFFRHLRVDVMPTFDQLSTKKIALEELGTKKTDRAKYHGWYSTARTKYKNVEAEVTNMKEEIVKIQGQGQKTGMDEAVMTEIVKTNVQHLQAKRK